MVGLDLFVFLWIQEQLEFARTCLKLFVRLFHTPLVALKYIYVGFCLRIYEYKCFLI